jgi:hypothetical protein
MQLVRSLRILPALVVALVALFAVATGTAMASSAHKAPTASVAKHKKHKPKKKKKPAKPTTPSTPSAPLSARDAGATPIGTGPDPTVVEQLNLPAGNFIVTAKAELGNNSANPNSISCQLLQGNNPIDSGTEALDPTATFSRTISLTGTAVGGGPMKLVCAGDKAGQARNRVITATRA